MIRDEKALEIINHTEDIKDVLSKIINDKTFISLLKYFYSSTEKEKYLSELKDIDSLTDFLTKFLVPILKRVLEKTSDGLTVYGLDKLHNKNSYLYISNHRDIFLDSAFLQVLLIENKLQTAQIAYGDNLEASNFLANFLKIQNMFTVYRGTSSKELYEKAKLLSEYIRETIAKGAESVWIAQGNGRAKNGEDKTQTSLLKMLNVSGTSSFVENFEKLNIIPIAISYEYEPCDAKKTQELYSSSIATYVKSPEEDFQSVVTGILQRKGQIHLSIGKSINKMLREIGDIKNENERMKIFSSIIDSQIIANYKLFKTNYMAYDLLNNSNEFKSQYTKEDKKQFIEYVSNQVVKLTGDKEALKEIMLNIYANPIKSKKRLELL